MRTISVIRTINDVLLERGLGLGLRGYTGGARAGLPEQQFSFAQKATFDADRLRLT